ncbi:hypothetical protein WH87_04645 [Devosia epidermidihirudinis]|uniref:Uncharacterized protein n=1 Tax=Devosia epidermidihirudinis TaxID=1293439 RepID=A0A0F5QES0_9HYPH|nr:hypothetical protein [Devosia epidermidihirudinis]KKC39492.1 hypothetical protein WH87_04645 [Devosia epidermidihirudinis]
MFQNVIIGWLARRILEIGGLIGAGLTAWNNLPPATQEAVLSILGNNWEQITLGALVPLGAMLWGYVWSALSTFKPQVVTSDGKRIALSRTGAAEAEAIAKLRPPRTLWERLTGK